MLAAFDHAVEYGEEFARAGGQCQFLGLASSQQPLVEAADHRVVATGHQCSHVEHRPNAGTVINDNKE